MRRHLACRLASATLMRRFPCDPVTVWRQGGTAEKGSAAVAAATEHKGSCGRRVEVGNFGDVRGNPKRFPTPEMLERDNSVS